MHTINNKNLEKKSHKIIEVKLCRLYLQNYV